MFISCTVLLVFADTSGCCVAIGRAVLPIATQQPDSQACGIGIYQMRCTAYKVAPDNGLIQSDTCRASNERIKFNHRNWCILLVHVRIHRVRYAITCPEDHTFKVSDVGH